MGLFDFLKGKQKKAPQHELPKREILLSDIRVGYFVEYQLRLWQVTAYNQYDFLDESMADEWELQEGEESIFLEVGEDDGMYWTVSKPISIGKIEGRVRQTIIDTDEPPERIVYDGRTYYLDDSGGGYCFEGGRDGDGEEFVYWTFETEDEKFVLTIERWDEADFEAFQGFYVNEDEFTNIYPSDQDNSV